MTGDTISGTTENIVAIEDAGIHASVPLPDLGSRRPAFVAQADFSDDAERAEYSCPQHQPLQREPAKYGAEVVVYRAKAATCNACPMQATCTERQHGRIMHRSFSANSLERVRGYQATAAYQQARRKRQVWVEPLFAKAKAWHGLRRLRLRSLDNVNIEGLLIAAGQNLNRFLAATGWGRRHAPCGSLLALQRAPRRRSAVDG